MRHALPIMRAQNYGRIINTVSRNAEVATPTTSAYAAAKAAMWATSRVTAAEVQDDLPQLQAPEVTYPTARMLASLPAGGPSGQVFWNEKVYPLFDPNNAIHSTENAAS
jgi:NAD(P)-dependent dehydrogenase (short-subunit alcohol dehydrogenase family)